MKNNFRDAVNKINQNCAVWMTYTEFNKKTKYARIHLNELKEVEEGLPHLRINKGPNSSLVGKTVDAYYRHLIPCVVEIKAAIECLKLSLAIMCADATYFDWKKTLRKIHTDLDIPVDRLTNIEGEIRDLRNSLVHAGSPLFSFNNKSMKLIVPKYTRLHPKLTIPTIEDGQLEVTNLLQTTLEKMEEFSEHLRNKEDFFRLKDTIEISQDWSKRT